MRFFLEQRMVHADEALRIGLIGEVVDSDDAFEERFLAYGQLLAGVAPSLPDRPNDWSDRSHDRPICPAPPPRAIRWALHGLSRFRGQPRGDSRHDGWGPAVVPGDGEGRATRPGMLKNGRLASSTSGSVPAP